MKDFAEPGHKELVFFDPEDKVRLHGESGVGPFYFAKVIRTGRTRVLIESEHRAKPFWVSNLRLSHDPSMLLPKIKGQPHDS